MENHAEGAAETRVAIENHAEGLAETRKEWRAPELRKVEIAEITANHIATVSDGAFTS